MGTHQPEATEADATTPTTPGPRQSAARHRKKRALIMASSAGAALLVAGTATAAVIATGGEPEQATQAATVPDASTDPLQGSAGAQEQADESAADHQAPDPATSSAQGQAQAEEEDESADEPSGSNEPDDSEDSQDTGEGGTCEASFYGEDFHGSTTANGETFDTHDMTAAHKTLPFDTEVEVTNPDNGQSVTVRINDRGPYIDGRCLDLSTAAFDEIIGTGSGVGTVDWRVLG